VVIGENCVVGDNIIFTTLLDDGVEIGKDCFIDRM
jgi:acetyltransferase-like isoleucine patch superfamily enzyme